MSARSERDAVLATLWFTVAHYCLRPWPWVLVALAALVLLYPDLTDREAGYVLVLRDHLPPGWRGLVVGAFFAAYMSTVSTQLNWGTSYLVNDVYRRFVRPDADQTHLVRVSRLTTILVMAASGAITFGLESVRQAWEFVLESGAGVGLVLILRWYWWRVTAVSELAALAAAAAGFAFVRLLTAVPFPESLLYLVPWTTACWIAATLATPPEPLSHLVRFYRRIRPAGPGWRHVATAAGESAPAPLAPDLRLWGAGCAAVYLTLAATHALLFGSAPVAALLLVCAVLLAAWLVRSRTRNRSAASDCHGHLPLPPPRRSNPPMRAPAPLPDIPPNGSDSPRSG